MEWWLWVIIICWLFSTMIQISLWFMIDRIAPTKFSELTLVNSNCIKYENINLFSKILLIILFTLLIGPFALLCHIIIFLNWAFHVGK